MNLFSNPMFAMEEAQQQADWHHQPYYLIDAGNSNIKVAKCYEANELILEVVRPQP